MATIVEFIGLPGAGKTTLSRKVATHLSHEQRVHEPTRTIETYATARRVGTKLKYTLDSAIHDPRTTYKTTKGVVTTKQASLSDLVRVTFNLQYVTGVTNRHRKKPGICLLDQGPYQALWSVGFRSARGWTAVLDSVDYPTRLRPDLAICVDVTESTIEDRLTNRSDGDTRFVPDTDAFEHGIDGYERLKSRLQTESAPQTLVIENDSPDTLEANAKRIADAILARHY